VIMWGEIHRYPVGNRGHGRAPPLRSRPWDTLAGARVHRPWSIPMARVG
jgi:hypothetical protein